MSVLITFEPSGISGVVAEGTYLIDAARRMGVTLGGGCTVGKGECPACLVSVKSGSELLSAPSAVEERLLGELLVTAQRLACQTKLQHPGEIVVAASAETFRPVSAQNVESDLTKKFGELSLPRKIATLLQFEAITMSEAFDSAIEKPLSLGAKAFDAISMRARAAGVRASSKK